MDDSAVTDAGIAIVVDVLAKDSDIEGDPLSITSGTSPGNGSITIHADNTITYTPNSGFAGVDSFDYTISDGELTSSATVNVMVVPVTAVCELYPIALHVDSLADVQVGDVIEDILNGEQPGNFGWLTWTGNNSVPALVASLTPPGNSHIYVNPNNPVDHVVSIGDWVEGKPGVSNAKPIGNALDGLMALDIIVPIWETSQGNGANTMYQISGFAQVRLLNYQLPQQDRISAQFLGYQACAD